MTDQNTHSNIVPTAQPRWIWFITGPTACGKTTIAKNLAEKLDLKYIEGDDYHPHANVEKMSRGEPLTDEDRRLWLKALAEHETAHPKGSGSHHLVITCSALKREYRDVLRQGAATAPELRIRFVHLEAPEKVLYERAVARKGHFAGGNLVHSQFAILEPPEHDERDTISINVDRPPEVVSEEVVAKVRQAMHV